MDIDNLPGLSDELRKLARQAYFEIGRENYSEALQLADQIEQLPPEPYSDFLQGAIRIDGGQDELEVSKAIELYRKHEPEFESDERRIPGSMSSPSFYYNLANGYAGLARLKRKKNKHYDYFQKTRTEFDYAKEYFRKALGSPKIIGRQKSLAHISLGSCLDDVGRTLDALECYDAALTVTPNSGEAQGHKGQCFYNLAWYSRKNLRLFLSESHYLLKIGVDSSDAPPFAKPTWSRLMSDIEKRLGDKIIEPPFNPKYENPGTTQVEKDYLDFGFKHKLYLNVCNYCSQRCNKAIKDTLNVESMVVPVTTDFENDPFLRLQNWMNQIRLAYATARYLLFQATQAPYDNDFVLKPVLIMETMDYSIYDIDTELLKVAFRSFYSILDQIAWILNEYLVLWIDLDKIYLSNAWYEIRGKKKHRERFVRPQILATDSPTLNALFDLNFDFENSESYNQLRKMRNCLIHRFVDVTDFQMNPTEDKLDKRELERRTIELAQIVRNAVAYLMFFLWKDTKEAAANKDSILPTLTLDKRE